MAAIRKERQSVVNVAPEAPASAVASTGASTLGYGVTFVTSTSTGTVLTLPAPTLQGVSATVIYAAGVAGTASTAEVLVYTHSTAVPFVGSTNTALSLDALGESATFTAFKGSTGLMQWVVTGSGTTDGLTLTAP